MTLVETLQKAGVKAAVVSIDLSEDVPVYRAALSKDGATCGDDRNDPMVGSGLTLEVAVSRALGGK